MVSVLLLLLAAHTSGAAVGASTQRRLLRVEHPPHDGATCGEFVPKIALLFLAREALPLEAVWMDWFALADHLVPWQSLEDVKANESSLERLSMLCSHSGDASPIDKQNLFSVYVHTPPCAPELAAEIAFHSKVIATRVMTEYAEHSIVEAQRMLLRAALEDESNIKFVVLSESCMPLYPPTMLWLQLLSETRSRVNTSPEGVIISGLLLHAMQRTLDTIRKNQQQERWQNLDYGKYSVSKADWRGSGSRSAFRRDHAELIAADVHFNKVFREHCIFKESRCVSDEHYIPTLLSKLGRENETASSGLTREYFHGDVHPQEFSASEIDAALIQRMRGCTPPPARQALSLFVNISLPDVAAQQPKMLWSESMLGGACTLFGRKFAADTAEQLQACLFDCKSELEFTAACSINVKVVRHDSHSED